MYILGISCFYHDSGVALVKDGKLIAAAQEERFTRIKHDQSFPKNAIKFCLDFAGIKINDLDYLGFYEKPFLKFERILQTYLLSAPRSYFSFIKAMPLWLKQKLWMKHAIQEETSFEGKIIFCEHHLAHAASAFLVSPFKKAAILTMDGVGEWATATKGYGDGNNIYLTHQINFPDSLGLLYSAFTYYCGFKVNSGEYKLMGLSPYGKPKYVKEILNNLIEIKDDGSFHLNQKYFAYTYGTLMINDNFRDLFGHKERHPDEKITSFYQDISKSIQAVTEEIILKAVKTLYKETRLTNLCLAGGVALNCVVNGRIIRESDFKELFVQPAAGDAGGALGTAFFIYNTLLDKKRVYQMDKAYFGPEFTNQEIKNFLDFHKVKYKYYQDTAGLIKDTAKLIKNQFVVGWFQGRMEYGPRALGNRSILADPRNPENQDRVNLKIKFREDFRPFAPTVLEECLNDYFDIDRPSPFMLLVCQVKDNPSPIPAVTHKDYSARIQSVSKTQNPFYHRLIKEFKHQTGCGVLINTSFNVRGEPIVCTPQDAYNCFMGTNMDYLAIGNFLLDKKKMKISKTHKEFKDKFELD
jgi:carbamoyltransferase